MLASFVLRWHRAAMDQIARETARQPEREPPDTPDRPNAPRSPGMPNRPGAPVVWVVVLASVAVELTLMAAEAGWFAGQERLREQAILYGAFWGALWEGWEPLFVAQPYTMFLSHGLLHGGLLHLVGNMVAVLGLGGLVVARAGQSGFAVVYLLGTIAGGAGFGLLGPPDQPMVGASGAVFALIGAWQFWDWEVRWRRGLSMTPVWRTLLGLVALNVILWLALSGFLAWEAHLGGFVIGWLWAAAFTRHHPAAF